MTATATLLRRGPINGTFTEKAALYRLSEPYIDSGKGFDHLLVSSIEADEFGPRDTLALVANEQGYVFLGENFPYQYEGDSDEKHGHEAALAALGYTLVPNDITVLPAEVDA